MALEMVPEAEARKLLGPKGSGVGDACLGERGGGVDLKHLRLKDLDVNRFILREHSRSIGDIACISSLSSKKDGSFSKACGLP